VFQFCDDWRNCPIPGITLDQQKDADGYLQYYLHVPWVMAPAAEAAQPARQRPVARRQAAGASFSAARLQTWLMGVMLTGIFALAKGPYLGW
jgi:hypothetical protein